MKRSTHSTASHLPEFISAPRISHQSESVYLPRTIPSLVAYYTIPYRVTIHYSLAPHTEMLFCTIYCIQ